MLTRTFTIRFTIQPIPTTVLIPTTANEDVVEMDAVKVDAEEANVDAVDAADVNAADAEAADADVDAADVNAANVNAAVDVDVDAADAEVTTATTMITALPPTTMIRNTFDCSLSSDNEADTQE